MFRFIIEVGKANALDSLLSLKFTQVFTAVSEEGNTSLERLKGEDFAGRLKKLEEFMAQHLDKKSK